LTIFQQGNFELMYRKYLCFVTGTAKKLSPGMSKVILVKSVHMTHFYNQSKFLCTTRNQDCKIVNVTFKYPIALIDNLSIYFGLLMELS
jgi:hypothetical protein